MHLHFRHRFHFFSFKEPLLNNPLKAILLVSGIFYFVTNLFAPLFAIFVEQVGGSVAEAGLASALYMFVAGIFTLVAGRLEFSPIRKKLALIASQLILALGYILYALTDSIAMFLIVQVILGFGESFYWPAFHATYAKHARGRKSALRWSVYDASSFFIPAASAALGGLLVSHYGFSPVFWGMAALSLISTIFITFLPRKMF